MPSFLSRLYVRFISFSWQTLSCFTFQCFSFINWNLMYVCWACVQKCIHKIGFLRIQSCHSISSLEDFSTVDLGQMKNSVQLHARVCFILCNWFFLKAYQWTIVVCIKRSTMEHMFLFLIKCDSSKPASSAMFFFFKSVSHNVPVLILFNFFFGRDWISSFAFQLFIYFFEVRCECESVFNLIIFTITQAHPCWTGTQYKKMNLI